MGAHEEAQGSRRVGASDEGNEGHEGNEEGHEEAQGSRRGGASDEGHEGYEGRESDESNEEGDESYESHEGDEGNEEVRACSCEHGVRRGQRSGCGIWTRVVEGFVRREEHRGSAVISVSG